jgi:hypothetical protein
MSARFPARRAFISRIMEQPEKKREGASASRTQRLAKEPDFLMNRRGR